MLPNTFSGPLCYLRSVDGTEKQTRASRIRLRKFSSSIGSVTWFLSWRSYSRNVPWTGIVQQSPSLSRSTSSLNIEFSFKISCHTKVKEPACFTIYEVHTISFQTFFVWAVKIVVDSWKFTMLLLSILWDDWLILTISGSNEQLQ